MNDKKTKKILIIEDDRYLMNLYELRFKKSGYDVVTASSGSNGLNVFASESPDIVILDLLLPGEIDGFAFLEELKVNQKNKTPVIVLSNLGQTEDIERAMSLGAENYFVKVNVEIGTMVSKIDEILDR